MVSVGTTKHLRPRARTMQRMAAERDAIARQAPVVHEFYRMAKEQGLKAALEWRDARFGDRPAKAGKD